MNFNPIPTVSAKCSKLKVKVMIDSVCCAGSAVSGTLELNCSDDCLLLGQIYVELNAFEELMGKDAFSKSFLVNKLVFQGSRTPPCIAVHGAFQNGFYLARKAKTVLPFTFDIPKDAPSSYSFPNIAQLRYVVSAFVQFKLKKSAEFVIKSQDIKVLDTLPLDSDAPLQLSQTIQIYDWGKSAHVFMQASISSTYACAGGKLAITVLVKNETKRKITGLKALYNRSLWLLQSQSKLDHEAQKISSNSTQIPLREKDHIFEPYETSSLTIKVPIPVRNFNPDWSRFDQKHDYLPNQMLDCFGIAAWVELYKDIVLELPIVVGHLPLDMMPLEDAQNQSNNMVMKTPSVHYNDASRASQNTSFSNETLRRDTALKDKDYSTTDSLRDNRASAEMIKTESIHNLDTLRSNNPKSCPKSSAETLMGNNLRLCSPHPPNNFKELENECGGQMKDINPTLTKLNTCGQRAQGDKTQRRPLPPTPADEYGNLGFYLGKAFEYAADAANSLFLTNEEHENRRKPLPIPFEECDEEKTMTFRPVKH